MKRWIRLQVAISIVAATAGMRPLLCAQQSPCVRLALAEDAALELEARWEPCRESKYGLFAENEVLRTLAPVESKHRYAAALFTPFLPKEPVSVGAVWEVEREAVLPFLRHFHPGARAELHHGSGAAPGTYACLRALGPQAVEILIRAHAEFELAGGVTYTPAQFEGRLVLDPTNGELRSFHLALPSRNTNVDVNAPMEYRETPDGPLQQGMEADIGWVPRMELASADSSEQRESAWTRSIPDTEARSLLARRFYAFAAIDWLSFDVAVQRALALEKPLHVVVLFGTLDDESC